MTGSKSTSLSNVTSSNKTLDTSSITTIAVSPDAPTSCSTWAEVKAVLEAGYSVKLVEDVAISAKNQSVYVTGSRTGDVTFDLNGHTVDGYNGSEQASEKDRVFTLVSSSAYKLTICDSAGGGSFVGHKTNDNGGGFAWVGGACQLTLDGGTVSGFSTVGNGGMVMARDGTFVMNGGMITNCVAGMNGGAVRVASTGTFTMNGGTIAGCSATGSAGAVSCDGASGTFNMYGGVLVGNTAGTDPLFGGTGTTTVSGGVSDSALIGEKKASGTSCTQVGTNYVVGTGIEQLGAKLSAGTYTFCPTNAEYAAAGLAVNAGSEVTAYATTPKTWTVRTYVEVQDPALANTTFKVLTNGVAIAKVGDKWLVVSNTTPAAVAYEAAAGYYFAGGLTAITNVAQTGTNPVTLPAAPAEPYPPHEHCICGDDASAISGHTHAKLVWKPWIETNSLPTTADNWYLVNDVTLAAEYHPVTGVKLCLNGKVVKQATSGERVIAVGNGKEVAITDCRTTGLLTGGGADDMTGGCVLVEGTLGLFGGSITGNVSSAGAVAMTATGTLVLGGRPVIADNETGGNLYLASGQTATISTDTPLTAGAQIRVTLQSVTGAFTSNGTVDDVAYFTSEDSRFVVECVDGHLELVDPKAIVSFKATTGSVTLAAQQYWNGTMQASTNANEWFTWNGSSITAADTLRVRGKGNTRVSYNGTTSAAWTLTGTKIAAGGRVDALLDCDKVTQGVEPTAVKGTFYKLFYGATSLIKAPELPLKRSYDLTYCGMFRDCTGLTETPEIPLTNVAYQACQDMFNGCSNLTNGPSILPATKIGGQGCSYMFSGCKKLQRAPVLPAMKLDMNSYSEMFRYCSALTRFPELPTVNLTQRCYANMFQETTISLYTPGLGEYWMIPSNAVEATNWKSEMFKMAKGTIPANCPIPGVKYHYQPWPKFQLTVPTVQNATVKLAYADDFVRPGESIGTTFGNHNVYSNFNVRVIYTAAYGHYFAGGVTCFTNVVSLQEAGTVPEVADAIAHWHGDKLIEKWIGTSADLASLLTTEVMTNGWLASNVTMSANVAVQDGFERFVCLNGKALDLGGKTLSVDAGAILVIDDCQGGGVISNGTIEANGMLAFEAGATPVLDAVLTVSEPGMLVIGTSAVVKMGANFDLPSAITVGTSEDLMVCGKVKVFELAEGVTTLDLEALAAKVVPYDPEGRGFSSFVMGNAIYVAARYLLTYDAMGGVWTDGVSVSNLYFCADESYAFPTAPQRKDYTFEGWYVSWTNGADIVTEGAKITVMTNHTLYAKWVQSGVTPGETIFTAKTGSDPDTVIVQGASTNEFGEIADANAVLVFPDRVDNTLDGKFITTVGRRAYAAAKYDDRVADDKKLRDVTIPAFLSRIGDEAFSGASHLTNLTFTVARDHKTGAKTTLDIGSRAFENTAVETLVFPAGSKTKLRANSFANCAKLREICVFGEIVGIERGPFTGCGEKDSEVVIRLSPSYATNTAFVAMLTADLNATRVKISSEPLGQVSYLSLPDFSVSGFVSFTFKLSVNTPWSEVSADAVTLFYTDDLSEGFVGTGKFKPALTVTGPDASGEYRVTFEDPALTSAKQFYRVTVGK